MKSLAKKSVSKKSRPAAKSPSQLHKSRRGQLSLLEAGKSAYGGSLRNTRRGRKGARPLSTRSTMHLVLRSSKARGDYSFLRPKNAKRIKSIIDKFSFIYGVQILSQANVGNHLHFHIRLGNQFGYAPFIKAVTGAIAMAVTGRNRWTTNASIANGTSATGNSIRTEPSTSATNGKFWDFRPFSRVVEGLKGLLRLMEYVRINQLEALGFQRPSARKILDRTKVRVQANQGSVEPSRK